MRLLAKVLAAVQWKKSLESLDFQCSFFPILKSKGSESTNARNPWHSLENWLRNRCSPVFVRNPVHAPESYSKPHLTQEPPNEREVRLQLQAPDVNQHLEAVGGVTVAVAETYKRTTTFLVLEGIRRPLHYKRISQQRTE